MRGYFRVTHSLVSEIIKSTSREKGLQNHKQKVELVFPGLMRYNENGDMCEGLTLYGRPFLAELQLNRKIIVQNKGFSSFTSVFVSKFYFNLPRVLLAATKTNFTCAFQ